MKRPVKKTKPLREITQLHRIGGGFCIKGNNGDDKELAGAVDLRLQMMME